MSLLSTYYRSISETNKLTLYVQRDILHDFTSLNSQVQKKKDEEYNSRKEAKKIWRKKNVCGGEHNVLIIYTDPVDRRGGAFWTG